MDTSKMRELKELAEAANAVTTDVNITMAVGADPVEVKAVQDYLQVAMPKTILALLAEIEGLHAQHGRDSGELRKLCSARDSARRQRDQLKAENEALRSAALAAREFIMREAEVRGLLDEPGQVSHRHPRRQAAIASIDAAMAKEASHD